MRLLVALAALAAAVLVLRRALTSGRSAAYAHTDDIEWLQEFIPRDYQFSSN